MAPGVRAAGVSPTRPCPCGSALPYSRCCEPFHDGRPAPTAQALMRSRYSAFVVGDEDYLFRTWHPRTRPEGPYCDPSTEWVGLTVHEVLDGGEHDSEGVIEFTARYRSMLPSLVASDGAKRGSTKRAGEGDSGARHGGAERVGEGYDGARHGGAERDGAGRGSARRGGASGPVEGELRERSRFVRRAGRWVYLEAL